MPVTKLDTTSALVVIDLQYGLLGYPRIAETGSTAEVLALLSTRGSLS
ncbi:MAG: hypothetical protein JO006_06975 [Paucibacter sp.]|nr:hypothetical protein [Roseateles sp.]